MEQSDNRFNPIWWINIANLFLLAIYCSRYIPNSKKIPFKYDFTFMKKELSKI